MTKTWTIEKIWAGETVAILGNGPAMTEAAANRARALGYKTIAVNRAVKFAPWADMFVALDPLHPFWAAAGDFAGIKVCGVECDEGNMRDAFYAGMRYETITFAPGHVIEIRNNLLAAMRIAFEAGAAKIVLIGVDPAAYAAEHAHTGFHGLAEGLAQLTAEFEAAGIAVETGETINGVLRTDGGARPAFRMSKHG